MFNNQREKTLAAVLGGAVILVLGFQMVDTWLLQPVNVVRSQVAAKAAKNEQLERDLQLVEHAQKNLVAVQGQSLPADPATASLVYQDWLLDRVQDARLNDAVVTPGRAIIEEGVGHRIPFTIQAEAGLRQIGRFLDDFYRTPVLHRITFLKIDSAGSRTSVNRRLTVTLEALALAGAEGRDSLPRPSRAVDRQWNHPALETYFARTDPFRRMVIKPASPPALVKSTPKRPAKETSRIDPLASVRLVASVLNGDSRKAWFFDTRTDQKFILAVGEELKVTGFTGRIVEVEADSITLAANDVSHTAQLGQTLRESINPAVN